MVLAHNLTAMNAQRQFNIVGTSKKKSTEKLSSGYKINRAADDAAGLTISEKMRSQIRGLHQASENCQDGVSLCQVADGALTETHDILQRMNELAIKSANGTNTDADREAIQKEVKQLTDEFDRIANSTSFNDKIYPLNAKTISEIETPGRRLILNGKFTANNGTQFSMELSAEDILIQLDTDGMVNGKQYHAGDEVSIKVLRTKTNLPVDNNDFIYISGLNEATNFKSNLRLGVGTTQKIIDFKESFISADENGHIIYDDGLIDGGRKGHLSYMEFNEIDYLAGMIVVEGPYYSELDSVPAGGLHTFHRSFGTITSGTTENAISESIVIQAGARNREEQQIPIHFVDATKRGLKLVDPEIDVSTKEGALSAIDRVANAIGIVSGYRSYFGATQNRLEHTIANLDNIVENTQAAESRIRDTDMATEMVNNTKLNILEQAVTSMMAQANQSTQGVLSLLQ